MKIIINSREIKVATNKLYENVKETRLTKNRSGLFFPIHLRQGVTWAFAVCVSDDSPYTYYRPFPVFTTKYLRDI